jgi:hypothetical protein
VKTTASFNLDLPPGCSAGATCSNALKNSDEFTGALSKVMSSVGPEVGIEDNLQEKYSEEFYKNNLHSHFYRGTTCISDN